MASDITTGALGGIPGFSGNAATGDQIVGDVLASSAFANFGKPMGKYLTGARTVIKINSELAGFAFQVSWNIRTEQDEIWTVDDWTPWEIAPKRIMVEGTLGMFHIPGKGPSKENIQADVLSFMFHKYITIEVRDARSDQLLFKTNKAVITSRQQEVKAEELSTIRLSWKAIGWADERFPALPGNLDSTADASGDSGVLGQLSSALGF